MGCSSQGSSFVRTTEVAPAYTGPVRVYASGNPPPGAVDLGVIEVHGEQQEGTVEELLPMFVRRVAELGGDAAVVDGVRARFELVPHVQIDSTYVICGRGHPCSSKTAYGSTDEVMIVSIVGRAMSTRGKPATLIPTREPETTTPSSTDPEPKSREPEPGPEEVQIQ
jgi:hypothetical protein